MAESRSGTEWFRQRIGLCLVGYGTFDSLLETSHFVHTIEQRQGLKVACLEEIASYNDWISSDQLRSQAPWVKPATANILAGLCLLPTIRKMLRRSPELIARQSGAEKKRIRMRGKVE